MSQKLKVALNLSLTILVFMASPALSMIEANQFKHLNFQDLEELSLREIPLPVQREKKAYILNTVMHSAEHLKSTSIKKHPELDHNYLRVSHWNIERGFKLEIIDLLFNDSQHYKKEFLKEDFDKDDIKDLDSEIELLKNTDVFTLNEVDIGMPRTGYKNIAEEFADMVNGSYAFITEFIELDPSIFEQDKLEKTKYKGLHGNAIVSRYPIIGTRIIRLPQCYDWFSRERESINLVEQIRRKSSKLALDEQIITEIRRGSRVALVAEIELPNKERIHAISVHLENRCKPKCREKQMNALLTEIQEINTPVILGGDLNNFEKSAEPTSIQQIITNRITDPHLIGKTVISVFNPFALITNASSVALSFLRKHKDPLVLGIPFFMPNRVKKLFTMLRDFKFSDLNQFDFSGDDKYSIDEKDDTLSNSNQRSIKGFIETFRFKRNFSIALYKIDWLFVKPLRINLEGEIDDTKKIADFKDLKDSEKKYFPAFGRTYKKLNYSLRGESISDHTPISVDVLF